MRRLALCCLCAVLPLTALAAGKETAKEPEKKEAYVPIPAFPAAGRHWQIGWWEDDRFHPARMLLGPDGSGIVLLPVENRTLGDFTAVLRLSEAGDALRVSYRDSDGGAWSAEAREAAAFRVPCPVFAREERPKVVIRAMER